MQAVNNVLLVRVPAQESVDGRELRDYILESLARGVLVLTEDASCEVMELPPLGGVAVAVTGQELSVIERPDLTTKAEGEITNPELSARDQSEGAEKRAIVQRLKDYRSAHGRGCLDKVSEKTAHRKESRISADTLRDIAADCAPKMGLTEWRKISKALDALEGKSNDSDRA